jgi:hypothetical protein
MDPVVGVNLGHATCPTCLHDVPLGSAAITPGIWPSAVPCHVVTLPLPRLGLLQHSALEYTHHRSCIRKSCISFRDRDVYGRRGGQEMREE